MSAPTSSMTTKRQQQKQQQQQEDEQIKTLIKQRKSEIYLKKKIPIPEKYEPTVSELLNEIDELRQELDLNHTVSVKNQLIKTRNELLEMKHKQETMEKLNSLPLVVPPSAVADAASTEEDLETRLAKLGGDS